MTTKSLGYDPLDRTSITRHTSWQTNITSTLSTNVIWDDPMSEDMLPLGEKWRTELPLLEKLMFPGSLKPTDFGDPLQT